MLIRAQFKAEKVLIVVPSDFSLTNLLSVVLASALDSLGVLS